MLSAPAIALRAVGIVALIAPGPTNTLLAAAGLRHGVRHSLPLIAAELAGRLVSIFVWGRFLAQAAHALPWSPSLLRGEGAGRRVDRAGRVFAVARVGCAALSVRLRGMVTRPCRCRRLALRANRAAPL
jgi:hypothetical protein